MSTDEQKIRAARLEVDKAVINLRRLVVSMCPGNHEPVQHRDRKPPWCDICHRDDRGNKIKD